MNKNDALNLLRERIFYGDLRPNQAINEKELMEELKIGRTPLREILIKLDSEKLVAITPNRGCYVSSIDFNELIDLIEIRKYLLVLVLRKISENASEQDLQNITEFTDNNQKQDLSNREIMKIDDEFHNRLNSLSCNIELVAYLANLRRRIVRVWSLINVRNQAFDFILEDHKKILISLSAGKLDDVTKSMNEHQEHFIELLRYAIN